MSVSTLTNKQQLTLDGVTSTATFTFRALTSAPEDIKCYVTTNGTDTALVYTTNFTVAINSDGVGGTVTLVAPATTGTGTLTVYRDTTLTQESDYDDYNQFPANTLETDLDKVMLIVQELTDGLDRAVKLAVTTTLTSSTLLLPSPVAGRALKWNAAATSLVNTDVDIDTAIAAATASQVAAATSATSALAAQTAAESHSTTAATHATTAGSYSTTAATHATTAGSHSTAAATSATTSASHATTALTASTSSASYSTTAATHATTAASHSTAAATFATTAASHATTALTASTTASSHATTALTASTAALSHSTAALTSATTAASHATTALTAATTAQATLTVVVNTQTGNYTLLLTDVNKMVDMNTAGACTLTIPSSGSVNFPTGSVIAIRQLGAGQVTITTSATVTLVYEIGQKTAGQYAVAAILKTGTNAWVAMGSLES